MSQRIAQATAIALFSVALLAAAKPAQAAASVPYTCSNATLRGTYGTELSGSASPDGVTQIAIAEVGFFRLDGSGHIAGNETFVVAGEAFRRELAGTYAVERDCHATFAVSVVGDDGPPIEFDGVVVDGGSSTLLIQTSPGATISGRSHRIAPSF